MTQRLPHRMVDLTDLPDGPVKVEGGALVPDENSSAIGSGADLPDPADYANQLFIVTGA